MPTVTETAIEAWASCHDGRCPGYKQQQVRGVLTTTQFSYFDFGGDVPGIERSTEMIRFADEADAVCDVCGQPRLIADQVRPIYPNVSGVPQDRLLHVNDDSERVRDMQLADAKREAEMAQMRALMERQAAAIERQERQIEQLSQRRGPGRPRKEEE
jgi:hypothetical protein